MNKSVWNESTFFYVNDLRFVDFGLGRATNRRIASHRRLSVSSAIMLCSMRRVLTDSDRHSVYFAPKFLLVVETLDPNQTTTSLYTPPTIILQIIVVSRFKTRFATFKIRIYFIGGVPGGGRFF